MGWLYLQEELLGELRCILEPGEESDEQLEKAKGNVVSLIKKHNLLKEELKYDTDFEKNCIILSQFTNSEIEKVSVRKYFTLIDHYNGINKKHGRTKNKL